MRNAAAELAQVGDGFYAYLQPDGGWGWSNAGLVADGDSTLLVDTLFDLRLTGEMLRAMRAAVPAAARIDTLVNTHANGDHCYGNQLLADARIVASERTATEMGELPPSAMAALVEQAPSRPMSGACATSAAIAEGGSSPISVAVRSEATMRAPARSWFP